MSKVEDKGRILKAAREKQLVMGKAKPHKAIRFFSRNFIAQKGVAWHIQSVERKTNKQTKIPLTKICYLACLSLRIEGKIKSFPDKQKLKEFVFLENGIIRNMKGTL